MTLSTFYTHTYSIIVCSLQFSFSILGRIAARRALVAVRVGCVERIGEMPRFRGERLEKVRRDGDAMKILHVEQSCLDDVTECIFNDSAMI